MHKDIPAAEMSQSWEKLIDANLGPNGSNAFGGGREIAFRYNLHVQLLDALKGVMEYAHLGAHCGDIDVNEQPQFVNARAAISKTEGRPQ